MNIHYLLIGRALGPRTTLRWRQGADAQTTTVWHFRLEARQRQLSRIDVHAQPLRPLHVGDHVRIQDKHTGEWRDRGIVVNLCPGGRSAVVEVGICKLLRNRRFMTTLPCEDQDQEGVDDNCAPTAAEEASQSPTPQPGPVSRLR